MKPAAVLSQSFHTLRSNRLRSSITIAIIALGITALVGIITALQAMNQKLIESFSSMGANGFTIRVKERSFRLGNERGGIQVTRKGQRLEKVSKLGQPVTQQQAECFRSLFRYPAQVGLSVSGGSLNSLSTAAKRTSPTVLLFGGDENNLDLHGHEISVGRNFAAGETAAGSAVVILGYDVAQKLFGDNKAVALNKEVRIRNISYRVIGVLKSRGTTFGFSRDNVALIPYRNLTRNFTYQSFTIGVKATQVARVEEAMGEAEGTFRNIRKLAMTEESNFTLEQSNSLAERAIRSLRYLTTAVMIIGLITLISAAIALMNIMLVAVAERTKEVGLLKALGARRKAIRQQFLCEAVLISLAGAAIGIALGILLGNIFGLLLQTAFVVPWSWIFYGVLICTIVGLAAGIYPAFKAGNLSPIDALRYE